jgi:hypothetical protein
MYMENSIPWFPSLNKSSYIDSQEKPTLLKSKPWAQMSEFDTNFYNYEDIKFILKKWLVIHHFLRSSPHRKDIYRWYVDNWGSSGWKVDINGDWERDIYVYVTSRSGALSELVL